MGKVRDTPSNDFGAIQYYEASGERFLEYTPHGNKRYTYEELDAYLSEFETATALMLIGMCSGPVTLAEELFANFEGVPMDDWHLALIAMRLIKVSSDYAPRQMTIRELATAVDMSYGLPEPPEAGSGGEGTLLRQTTAFEYQHPIGYLIPRILSLFVDIPKERQIDIGAISAALADEFKTEITIEEILQLGRLYWRQFDAGSQRIWFNLFPPPNHEDIRYRVASKHQAFLRWCTTDYEDFRHRIDQQKKILQHDCLLYALNPLFAKPVVLPSRNPAGGIPLTYIAPIPRLIQDKSTRGLFHVLSSRFQIEGSRNNSFRTLFGKLFEEYVLLLLREAEKVGVVSGERSYARAKNPDALVKYGDAKCVFIQAKVSTVTLQSRGTGNMQDARRDLAKSVARGVEQLYEFERDIATHKYEQLKDLENIQHIHRLVISYDSFAFSNSLLRPAITQALIELDAKRVEEQKPPLNIPSTFEYQLLSVAELENLTAIPDINLFDVLDSKSSSPDSAAMDMGTYIARDFPNVRNAYLDSRYDLFAERALSSELIRLLH